MLRTYTPRTDHDLGPIHHIEYIVHNNHLPVDRIGHIDHVDRIGHIDHIDRIDHIDHLQ